MVTYDIINTTHTNSAHAIYFRGSDSNNVTNTNISTAGGSSQDVYTRGTNHYTNYLINCTFNQSNVGFESGTTNKITVQWYIRVNITDTSNNPISSANVTVYNVSNVSVGFNTTNSLGLTKWFILTEYTQNAFQIYPDNVSYHTPHIITATKFGYTEESKQVNLTQSMKIYLTLNSIIPDLTLSSLDITFSDSEPEPNQIVTITATVHNLGNADANNFTVEFLLDETSKENKTLSVASISTNQTSFLWTAEEGIHTIMIRLDPNNKIIETNEDNNNATRDITVTSSSPSPHHAMTEERIRMKLT